MLSNFLWELSQKPFQSIDTGFTERKKKLNNSDINLDKRSNFMVELYEFFLTENLSWMDIFKKNYYSASWFLSRLVLMNHLDSVGWTNQLESTL